MRKFFLVLMLSAVILSPGIATADIYTLRMGDGAAAIPTAATASATFIDKYSDAGSLISSVALPTTVSGANRPLTESANSTSIGHLSLSVDGQYLMLGGYDADVGTTNVRQGTTGRVIGRVSLSNFTAGGVNTTTSLTDAYPGSSGNNNDMRSVVSTDGTNFWTSGTSFPAFPGNNSGIHYATLGATTSFRMSNNPVNTRVANIFNNQLYMSSASGAFVGVSTVGTGVTVPTGDDQSTTTLLFGTGAGSSPYDFWFKDANTVYVADDRVSASGGGIQKWEFISGSWGLSYTLNTNLGTGGVRGLDGAIVGGNPVLWATTAPSTTDGTVQNAVVTVTDTGAASAFSNVFNAATNTTARGIVRIAPPAGLTGDYNNDGKVDAGDYATWKKAEGTGNVLANDPIGGTIGAGQYTNWRANFGKPPGAGSGLEAASVPEPASAVLLMIGLVAFCSRRRSLSGNVRFETHKPKASKEALGFFVAGFAVS